MYAEILVAKRLPLIFTSLTYKVPPELPLLKPGQLVQIPFRNTDEYGVIISLSPQSPENTASLKSIKKIINVHPVLSTEQLSFLKELGLLYHTSWGFLAKSNLFPLQKQKITRFSQATPLSADNPPTKQSIQKRSAHLFLYNHLEDQKNYLRKQLSASGEHVILIPEVASLPEVLSYLPDEYLKQTITITSELSNKELFQAWLALWQQEKTIVVGTRRALFLPFKNLKKIFICDEANPSYKSWDMAPRFHTRDAARLLASKYHAELHILTHTPSVETFFLFNKDSSKPLSIKPFSTSPYFIKPEKNSVTTIFTHAVEERIEDITNKETIFLFTNHRGSFNYLFCRDCKKVLSCPQCYSHFTYHQKTNSLRCHKCGFTQPISQNCPACGGYELIKYGAGTERVEECLRELLKNNPPQKIITIDTDTALPPRAQEKSTVHPIIIGTTAAWNRVPWKDIALMVYIDPDNLFFIPEYKTSEYGWYYLRDSLARLPKTAEFYIQTERPEHAVFQGLTDPNTFYTTELAIREKLKYPPYATLVKLYYGAPSINEGDLETKRLYHTLVDLTKQGYPITILSPMPLFPHFYNKKYWKAILLKFKPEHFKAGFKRLLPHIPPNWKIDINPNKVLTIT